MTFERWNYLAGLLIMTGLAWYQFRAAALDEDTARGERMRNYACVAVFLAVLALLGLIFDPETRYPR